MERYYRCWSRNCDASFVAREPKQRWPRPNHTLGRSIRARARARSYLPYNFISTERGPERSSSVQPRPVPTYEHPSNRRNPRKTQRNVEDISPFYSTDCAARSRRRIRRTNRMDREKNTERVREKERGKDMERFELLGNFKWYPRLHIASWKPCV